jgi:hypothetical protein
MLGAYGNLPRPELWLPYVCTSIDDPRLDEICARISVALGVRRSDQVLALLAETQAEKKK